MPLFLLKYWRFALSAVIVAVITFSILRWGHARYDAGWAENEARWQPVVAAANKALAEANARTQALESAAQAITNEAENRHAQTIADLNQRAADADTRVRGLLRQLAATHSCGGQLPQAGNSTAVPDAAGAGDERADRFGSAATELARRCESDARTLTELQGWVRAQVALSQ